MRIIYGKSVYETNEAWVEPYLIGWSLYFKVNGIKKMICLPICLPNTTYEKEENVTKRFLEPLMENGFLKL